ncbi:uncharacterized protein LOC115033855 [Acyrthosiphon pisum]|uniref:Endonuclease/exonuclease/phosphatase domain-containing protein n=1 Tax=Acyrthosiphon pisum TaxID=7029 RepID=A0A8R2JQW0_ACYPI|nr:uncharacterized protein LOC115033855 [Acyrthosiphon pisum]
MCNSKSVINPRLTILTLDSKWFGVVFVNVHAPTEDKDDNEKDDFYSLLDIHCESNINLPRNCGSKDFRLENWKSALRFGTWNVRTLFKPGAVGTVVKEIERYKLGVVALQEMRWQDTGSMQISNITLFFGACDGRRQAGSGFAVNNKLLTAVKCFKVINPRLTILTLDTKWFGVVFVNVHAPTEDKDDHEKDDFYSLLDNTLCEIPRGCVQIILGDFNAKIGREECFKPIIGEHSLHQLSNDNGCRLIDLATGRNLRVKSTMFPHKNIHKGTWRSPDGRHVNQIDHVLVNERFNNSIMDVKTVRGADSDSDHFLVAGRLRVKLKRRQELRRGGATGRFDIANLNYPVVVENFQKGIEEKLRRMIASESGREVEQRWKTVKQLIQEEAEKTIGKQKTKKKTWFNDICEEAIERRRNARNIWLSDTDSVEKLERFKMRQREASNILRCEKRKYLQNILKEAEQNFTSHNTRDLYKKVNFLSKKYKQPEKFLKNDDGTLITSKEEIANKWTNYFKQLLNCNTPDSLFHFENMETNNTICLAPSKEEIQEQIRNLKNHKHPEKMVSLGELLKSMGNGLLEYVSGL